MYVTRTEKRDKPPLPLSTHRVTYYTHHFCWPVVLGVHLHSYFTCSLVHPLLLHPLALPPAHTHTHTLIITVFSIDDPLPFLVSVTLYHIKPHLQNIHSNFFECQFHEFSYTVHFTCGYHKVLRPVLLQHQPHGLQGVAFRMRGQAKIMLEGGGGGLDMCCVSLEASLACRTHKIVQALAFRTHKTTVLTLACFTH